MLRLLRRCHPPRLTSHSSCPLTIKLKQLDKGQLTWRLQETATLDEKQFTMTENETFMELEEHLTSHLENIKDVSFIDYDRSSIAATNQLHQIGYGFQIELTT